MRFAYPKTQRKKPRKIRQAELVLDIIAQINAGESADDIDLKHGQAVAIMTGAPLPLAANAVYMREDCTVDQSRGQVTVPYGLKPKANCRFVGEDVARDTLLLRKGQRISGADLGLLAQQGYSAKWCSTRK